MTNESPQAPTQNQSNIFERFMNFKRTFQGDPKAMINQMLASGQISQEQLNNAMTMANQMKSMFGIK